MKHDGKDSSDPTTLPMYVPLLNQGSHMEARQRCFRYVHSILIHHTVQSNPFQSKTPQEPSNEFIQLSRHPRRSFHTLSSCRTSCIVNPNPSTVVLLTTPIKPSISISNHGLRIAGQSLMPAISTPSILSSSSRTGALLMLEYPSSVGTRCIATPPK
jgi:hypothetical protein